MKEGQWNKMRADRISFEPQRLQPMIKANNRFIVEDRRSYGRSPKHAENGSVLFEQHNFQPAINTNNHYIEEKSRNYERGRCQQYDQGVANGL